MKTKRKTDLAKQLRKAIKDSGLSQYRLEKLSGVPQPQLSMFLSGERDMTLGTASKLVDALGLELRPKTKRKR